MFFFLNTTTIYSYPGHGFQIINQSFYHSNKFELQRMSWLLSLLKCQSLLPTTVLFSRWFLHSQSGNMIISRIYYFQKFQIRSSLTHDHLDHTCSRWKNWQNNLLWAGIYFFFPSYYMILSDQFLILTLYTLSSVCIFSILFSIHFLWYWLREFV